MNHIAIDLGGRESQICVRDEKGNILEERRVRTGSIGTYLSKAPPGRVVVETCAETFRVVDVARGLGHETCVVSSHLVRALGVGERRTKNDQRDARKLSEASCRMDLPSVHIASKEARDQKSRCNQREALVEARTKLINGVRGWLRVVGISPSSGSAETFAARVRRASEFELPRYIERQLEVIDDIKEAIDESTEEVKQLAQSDETCQALMTVPGVGPQTAIRFKNGLDELSRFANAHAVESYVGLAPGENSSSERKRITSITKAGSRKLRWLLIQAAWTARRCRPNDPMVVWSLEVEKRRGKFVAVTALARKLAGILFAIWRDGSRYQPGRAAAKPREDNKPQEPRRRVYQLRAPAKPAAEP
jgi:transposase